LSQWTVTSSKHNKQQQTQTNLKFIIFFLSFFSSESKVLYSKKYGVDLVRFTRQKESIVSASNNEWDHTLRHLSLHTNQYIRYFKGHRARVTSLALSPKSDLFLSAALDSTIRLWDLRSNSCQGLLRRAGRSAVQFDPTGAVFAVGAGSNSLKLYDTRHFDNGPFLNIELTQLHACIGRDGAVQWTDLKFGADGATLLASTAGGIVYLFDAFSGELLQTFGPHVRNVDVPPPRLEASFTPDGKFVLCGADDGSIAVYNTSNGALAATWRGHSKPVSAVRFNPRLMMAASACNTLALWLPPEMES
jgi:COMPASS component SWD2